MEPAIRSALDAIRSTNREEQGSAYQPLLQATEQPVGWAYEGRDELRAMLESKDNRARSIASQSLASLAKSDPKARLLRDFDAVLHVTRDARFVTARHALQSIWRIGAVGTRQRKMVLEGLARRFTDCAAEKNCTLIRYDTQECLTKLFEASGDAAVRERALALIEAEADAKYRKKYAAVWNKR
jgi:HEAT repeat protein